jgi:hypothetical protein
MRDLNQKQLRSCKKANLLLVVKPKDMHIQSDIMGFLCTVMINHLVLKLTLQVEVAL